MKHMHRLTVFVLIVFMLVSLARPVAAEAPPPPEEPGGAPAADNSPANTEEEDSSEPIDPQTGDTIRPPLADPNAVAPAKVGTFPADGALLDSSGNPASAANLAQLSGPADPQACPPGIKPIWMLGGTGIGCKPVRGTINDAIADASTGWTVWVEWGNYNEEVVINKAIHVVGENDFTAIRSTPIIMDPHLGINPYAVNFYSANASLQNFTVSGRVFAANLTGSLRLQNVDVNYWGLDEPAINLAGITGAITLLNVTSGDNWGGAFLETFNTSTLKVINSNFNYNDNYGLFIQAKGPVRLENISASGQLNGDGMLLCWFGSSLTIKNGTFNNNHDAFANNNYGNGIDMCGDPWAKGGSVLLDRVDASDNQESGIKFENVGAVTVTNSTINRNDVGGLKLLNNKSTVTISNSHFDDNQAPGCTSCRGLWIDSPTQYGLSITNSTFRNNRAGMEVITGGSITFRNVQANENDISFGALLDNRTYATAARTVSISTGVFNLNDDGGLEIKSRGTVTLNNIRANNNINGSGVKVDNCLFDGVKCTYTAGVSLSDTLGTNEISSNAENGLSILSGGSITVSGLTLVSDNGLDGVLLSNSHGTGSITLTRAKTIANGTSGYSFYTKGTVTISKTTAIANGMNNIFIDNAAAGKTVTISDTLVQSGDYGIEVYAAGPLILRNVTVRGQGLRGMMLDNTVGSGSISLTNVYSTNNGQQGVAIRANGNVSLSAMQVNSNAGGIDIDTTTASTLPRTVNIRSAQANWNSEYGMRVKTRGSIALSRVDVQGTYFGATAWGLYLDNCVGPSSAACSGNGSVTISSTQDANRIYDNGAAGVHITTRGVVTLSDLDVQSSGWDGIWIDSGGSGTVSVSRAVLMGNGAGLNVVSKGPISLNMVTSKYNTDWGVDLNNSDAASAQRVSISHGQFSANGAYGLNVLSKSSITLNHVIANSNNPGGNSVGAKLDNCADKGAGCTGSGSITISNTLGANEFNANSADGLNLVTTSSATLTGVTASFNGWDGLFAEWIGGSSGLTLSNSVFNNNGGYGAEIYSPGKVSLDKVQANTNADYGVWIDNTSSSTFQPVTVTNGDFDYNDKTGLGIKSEGLITLNHINASYNKWSGVDMYNHIGGTAGVNILSTLGVNHMENNGAHGLYVLSNGNIVMNNTMVNGNGFVGADNPPEGYVAVLLSTTGLSTIRVSCSMFSNNARHGLRVTLGGGTLTLTGVGFLDNNRKGGGSDPDLEVIGGSGTLYVYSTCGY